MTIDDAIRHHAAQGRLSLTVVGTSSGSYQASLGVAHNAFRVEVDADPATALLRVLGLAPGAAGQLLDQPSDMGVFD